MLTSKRRVEIWNAIYANPCVLDFDVLDTEERSFAIGIVISAGVRNEFKPGHFNEKQLDFIKRAKDAP